MYYKYPKFGIGDTVKIIGEKAWTMNPYLTGPFKIVAVNGDPDYIYEVELSDGSKLNYAEEMLEEVKPTDPNDACSCSTRDLLFFGHKCGRKAPIDKRK